MLVEAEGDDNANKDQDLKVYLPGDKLEKDEQLQVDNSAYHMLHSMNMHWPSLSFDVIPDTLGEDRSRYPHTMYLFTGSQAETSNHNDVTVMKLTHLHRTINDDREGSDIEDDEGDLDDDPVLESRTMRHEGGVNRVRVNANRERLWGATWSDRGKVFIWNLRGIVDALDTPGMTVPAGGTRPVFTVSAHRDEGFAMDWSPDGAGRLLTGDCSSMIYLTLPKQGGGFVTEAGSNRAFRAHQSSVEDIQWSPEEPSVFASCSADRTVRLWDIRMPQRNRAALAAEVHKEDVNVISWNRRVRYLLASGCDDGSFGVWDLRMWSAAASAGGSSNGGVINKPSPVASFNWNAGPITSIEWHPNDDSVLAVSGADDQLTLWDLSVEPDPEQQTNKTQQVIVGADGKTRKVPPQLLFIHQGQQDIKELHWHPQIPGVMVSTALSGFNVFKTISV
ncbi:Ribosome assembly protein rrb1 [Spiromyces aspiralis]|uniref:Ribosome assembly protein rrb1 n=1 Tax=Spiromyces aspiralis TaxID=68401 RepID=A0ACC1HSS9_9FUNG|nr:Ribosome assembly protein rrb1 [Spiromyces aspiralis]